MRVARVMGHLTLTRKDPGYKPGAFLICEALDENGLKDARAFTHREITMDQSYVVYDPHGAGVGDLIAVAEGPESALPFRPDIVPCDASCAAILDSIEFE